MLCFCPNSAARRASAVQRSAVDGGTFTSSYGLPFTVVVCWVASEVPIPLSSSVRTARAPSAMKSYPVTRGRSASEIFPPVAAG